MTEEKSSVSPEGSFAGIDLTSSPKKPSAYALLGAGLKIRFLGSLRTNSELIEITERHRPILVAIDAPLSLPVGLCCMNEDCLCEASSKREGRLCERKLAKNGIPSYFTTKRSIIKKMVSRALDLKKDLVARGHDVIEIYPYASKVRLWKNERIPKRTTPEGLRFLKTQLANIMPDISKHKAKLNHDLCDAAIAAYTAYLHHQGNTDLIGDREEGLISIPSSTPTS